MTSAAFMDTLRHYHLNGKGFPQNEHEKRVIAVAAALELINTRLSTLDVRSEAAVADLSQMVSPLADSIQAALEKENQ